VREGPGSGEEVVHPSPKPKVGRPKLGKRGKDASASGKKKALKREFSSLELSELMTVISQFCDFYPLLFLKTSHVKEHRVRANTS
jgi:hypothetical protein